MDAVPGRGADAFEGLLVRWRGDQEEVRWRGAAVAESMVVHSDSEEEEERQLADGWEGGEGG